MAKRIVLRVLPVQGGYHWRLKWPKGFRGYLTQAAAIRDGREWGRQHWFHGRPAQLVVHGRDMKIRFENTYGRDPVRRKG